MIPLKSASETLRDLEKWMVKKGPFPFSLNDLIDLRTSVEELEALEEDFLEVEGERDNLKEDALVAAEEMAALQEELGEVALLKSRLEALEKECNSLSDERDSLKQELYELHESD